MSFISILKSMPMQIATKMAPVTAKAATHAPELLLGGGMVCVVGGTVYACKKTIDVKELVEKRLEEAEELKKSEVERSEIVKHHGMTALKVTEKYAIPTTLIFGGLIMIGLSHNILNKRMLEAVAGMEAYRISLEQYRKRVAEEVGPSKELELYNGGGVQKKDVYVEQENGKLKKQKIDVKVRNDGEFTDPYMVRFARDTSNEWHNNRAMNMDLIERVTVLANRRLMIHPYGRVTLGWVYEQLGIHDYHPIGAVAGWVKDNGDNCIVIDVDESYSEEELEAAYIETRPPVPDLWLKFNCEGNIVNVD